MSASRPPCPCCGSTRLLRIARVMDWGDGDGETTWYPRPVGLVSEGGAERPVGHWETLICRGCAHTRWYALDWAELRAGARSAWCTDCAAETPQVTRGAVEHTATFGSRYDQPRIVRGLVGWEGLLLHSLCTTCNHAQWSGAEYQHLTDETLFRYELLEWKKQPCLRCHATAALLVYTARDYDGVEIPITVQQAQLLKVFSFSRAAGGFSLRLCRPFGAQGPYR